jgi:hypothetical protein
MHHPSPLQLDYLIEFKLESAQYFSCLKLPEQSGNALIFQRAKLLRIGQPDPLIRFDRTGCRGFNRI